MNSKPIESDPRFVPHAKTSHAAIWPRIVVLLVLAGYVGIAAAQDEPIQVWLVVLAPLALIAIAAALGVRDASPSD